MALAEAERTFPVKPEGPDPWVTAGRLALAAGAPEKAERYLAPALALGWPSLALDAYRRAPAVDPSVELDLSGVLVPDTAYPVAGRP